MAHLVNLCDGMARKPRIQTPGLIRHVMARGNGRMQIFLDDSDYRRFVFLFGEVVQEFDLECWNYCVMPNHYHATLCPTRPNLSEAIRRLNSEYAQWWNSRHDRVGHVFQGRFKDQIVQRQDYLLCLCRYVALNPVRAQLCAKPEDWPCSIYAAIVGKQLRPPFLNVDSTLQHFGAGPVTTLQHRFADFVTSNADDQATMDRIRSNERILGDRPFKVAVTAGADGCAAVLRGAASTEVDASAADAMNTVS
jgi:REP element-mobilizing transposase RayT